jgi:hypothetical protein
VIAVVRWRRRPAAGGGESPPELSAADSARLEQDLTRYDL